MTMYTSATAAAALGCSKQTIQKYAKKLGLTHDTIYWTAEQFEQMRQRWAASHHPQPFIDEKEVIRLSREGLSAEEVGNRMGIARYRIAEVRQRLGIARLTSRQYRRGFVCPYLRMLGQPVDKADWQHARSQARDFAGNHRFTCTVRKQVIIAADFVSDFCLTSYHQRCLFKPQDG